MNRSHLVTSATVLFVIAGSCLGQTVTTTTTTNITPPATTSTPPIPDGRVIIVPTTPRVPAAWRIVRVSSVDCTLTIDDQLATTLLELSVTNQSSSAQEAELLLPIPIGSTIRSFQYDGTGPEPTARVLPKDEARRIYNSIVHSQKDPGLLEFAGQALIRTSAFPIPAGATQKIRITVEQLLSADNSRLDYVLPKSDALATETSVPWTIKGTIKSPREISTVFSPSHDLVTERKGKTEVAFSIPARSASGTGSFRLSWMAPTSLAEPSGMLYAYPDSTIAGGKGGYFLFVASVPSERPPGTKPALRDVQIVIDRSGSMRGEKIQQAKKAALNVLQGLTDGETFNIIDYSDAVNSFSPVPIARTADSAAKAAAYINAIEANGGTNIGDALAEAFRAPITPSSGGPGVMPLVLFLTDGLPTVGERREGALREAARTANTMSRRVFTFGVGYDVNAPLLTGLAKQSRAAATFVLPDEDVELKVSQVYRRLSGPILGFPKLTPGGPVDGAPLWRDQLPAELPDLFEGDQLVVVGQYTGASQDLRLSLEGDGFGAKRNYAFNFKLDQASPRHGFVGRLWATRKVASLVEGLRLQSADGNLPPANDAKFKEVVDEIVRLSTRWGVLTEYTSFLALEPGAVVTNLDGSTRPAPSTAGGIRVLAEQQLRAGSAAPNRSGGAGVAKDQDTKTKGEASNAQSANSYYRFSGTDGSDKRVDVQQSVSVQNINSQSYFKRTNRWIDGRLIDKADAAPDTTISLGSAEFDALADKLDAEGQTGVLALEGELLLLVGGKIYLVKP